MRSPAARGAQAKLLVGCGVLLLVATVAAAGGLWWAQGEAGRRALTRRAELEARLDTLRVGEDAASACAVYEHSMLSAGSLAVDCDDASLTQVSARAYRLEGAVRTREAQQAWLGGGHRTPVCMGRGPEGWRFLGDAFDLDDCRVALEGGEAEVEERYEARARELIATVREALAQEAPVDSACGALRPTRPYLSMVERELLEGRQERSLHSSPPFGACLLGARPGSACELRETPAYVLVIEEATRVEPHATGNHEYTPGRVRGRLVLVDVAAGEVVCARDHAVDLDDPTVFGDVPSEWRERESRALREGVEALGGGALRLDPYYDP